MTALMFASWKGYYKVVGTLLQRGASADMKDKVYLCVIRTILASYTCIVCLIVATTEVNT